MTSALQNSKSVLVRSVLWMAWSGAVSIANSVAVWVVMARWRSPDEIGRFTVVMSIYMLFFTICSLGLSPYLVNEISRRRTNGAIETDDAKKFTGTAAMSLLLWGTICAGLMTLCGLAFGASAEIRTATMILSLAMIPTGAIVSAESAALADGRTRLIAAVTTLENVLRTILPIAVIWSGGSLTIICAAFAFVRFVSFGVYWFAVRRSFSFAFDRQVCRKLLKITPTFAGITILASLNWQIVTLYLGRFASEFEAAKYGTASRFLIPVMILTAGYAGVLQPLMANRSGDQLGVYLSKIIARLLPAATFAALLAPFFSGFVLTFLFGAKYAEAAPTLNILALTVAPFCAVMIFGRGLVAAESPHIDLIANAVGVTVCAGAGALLIPRYAANGAAATQFLSLAAMAIFEIIFLSRKISGFKIWGVTAFSSACLLICGVFIWK